jgi:hypothetical protein
MLTADARLVALLLPEGFSMAHNVTASAINATIDPTPVHQGLPRNFPKPRLVSTFPRFPVLLRADRLCTMVTPI